MKFGGGKTIREGMGQATGLSEKDTLDLVITNALIVDWSGIYKVYLMARYECVLSLLTSRVGRYWCLRWYHRWYWESRQSRRHGRGRPTSSRGIFYRSHRGREAHHHCWSYRRPLPLHLPATSHRSSCGRYDDHDWWRHGPGRGYQCDNMYTEPLLHASYARGYRWLADELCVYRQG